MTDKWQAGHTYAPGALVTRASTPPIEATQATNGYFEDGATGWTFSGSCAYAATGGYSSNGCCIAPGSTAGGLALNDAKFLMAPGERISATCMIQQGASDVDHTRGYVQVLFFDASDAQIGEPVSGNVVNDGRGGAWHASTASGVAAPAATAYARCGIYLYQNSADPVWGDNLVVTYARTAPPSGLIFKAVQAAPGKSGTNEPTWPLVNGVQVVDNEVTWEAVTMVRVVWQASPILLSGDTEPAWPTEVGAFVHDGVINWEAIDRRVSDPKCPASKVVAIMASKVFAADRDIVRFSATVNPLDWSTAQDAGYLPTGLQQANANDMAVLAPYRSNLTAFNASSFQNWQVDPDPAAMALLDQMEGIGSIHQHAAQPVGNELFYLSQLGVRSVSVAAGADSLSAGDVGIPVDPLVQNAVRVSAANGAKVLATYYPSAGQYWLAASEYPPDALAITGMLPQGMVGQLAPVLYQYAVTGGVLPRVVSLQSGALPTGLSVDSSGLVTGSFTAVGDFTWVLQVVDEAGTVATVSQTMTVVAITALDPATLMAFGTGGSISADNLTLTKTDDGAGFTCAARAPTSALKTVGKFYIEYTVLVGTTGSPAGSDFGLLNGSDIPVSLSRNHGVFDLLGNGGAGANGALSLTGPVFNNPGVTVGIAVDTATGDVWWRDSSGWNPGGDPETGTGVYATISPSDLDGGLLPYASTYSSNGKCRVNFGQEAFKLGDVPAGFFGGWQA